MRFHQQNPNISGSYKVAPWNTLTASLTAAFAARKSPDIVYLPPAGGERQQKQGKDVVVRADVTFAKPEIYEALEARGVK